MGAQLADGGDNDVDYEQGRPAFFHCRSQGENTSQQKNHIPADGFVGFVNGYAAGKYQQETADKGAQQNRQQLESGGADDERDDGDGKEHFAFAEGGILHF